MTRRNDEVGVSGIMTAVFSMIITGCSFLPWKAVSGHTAAEYEIAHAAGRAMDHVPGRGFVLLALTVVPLGCHAANAVIQMAEARPLCRCGS